MEKTALLGGFGGQGVQTLGKMLTYAANEMNLYVTYYPSYGGEMRGGTSNCTLVFSDKEIGSPNRTKVDYVVALNGPAFHAFEDRVVEGGTLILNTSLVTEQPSRTDIMLTGLALNELTVEFGTPMVLNVIMFGFFVEYTGIVTTEVARKVVQDYLGKRKEMRETNLKAFNKGVELAVKAKR